MKSAELIRIALFGYGKMGKTIEELIHAELRDRATVGLIIDLDNRTSLTPEELRSKADVAIEFTGPDSAIENIRFCFEAGIPCVSGSTGWTKELQKLQLEAIERDASFLYAPNFSIGVNIFFELNRLLADIMDKHEDYDVLMEEIHHTEKKDSPSGTALFAAFDILRKLRRKDSWKNRESDNKATLEILSSRLPDVPGTHIVRYFNDIDEIEIRHTAKNRRGFAGGAIIAALWLIGRTGAYTMDDVLGFNQ